MTDETEPARRCRRVGCGREVPESLGARPREYVPELKGGRLALAESTNTAELPRPSRSED